MIQAPVSKVGIAIAIATGLLCAPVSVSAEQGAPWHEAITEARKLAKWSAESGGRWSERRGGRMAFRGGDEGELVFEAERCERVREGVFECDAASFVVSEWRGVSARCELERDSVNEAHTLTCDDVELERGEGARVSAERATFADGQVRALKGVARAVREVEQKRDGLER